MASAAVTGTIRDAMTGLPVPGAEVRAAAVELEPTMGLRPAEPGSAPYPAGGERVTTCTDAGGAFALTLLWPGEGDASASKRPPRSAPRSWCWTRRRAPPSPAPP